MEIRLLTSPEDAALYTGWLQSHPDASLWQSMEWKSYQAALGRTVKVYLAMEGRQITASALVVIDRTIFGLSTWDIPRGPLGNGTETTEALLDRIEDDARRDKCISVYSSPEFRVAGAEFRRSRRYVMPETTRMLDLTLSKEDLLAQMKQKGRYNIRLAEKHGVRVELSPDIDAFAALARETAERDEFQSTGARTYLRFLECLPQSFLLLAHAPKNGEKTPASQAPDDDEPHAREKPIAGLLGVIWGKTGTYYYGASSNRHRELMAPYLLQWQAIQHCRKHGCTRYDLFGIAPEGIVGHPWSSVSEFKAKFGGTAFTYPPEQEIVLRPLTKALLNLKRRLLG